MCLLGIVFQTTADCPVLLLANRDEDPHRPTAGPQIVHETSHEVRWLGGRDRQAAGTWLGINEHGLIVAVTNRQRLNPPQSPRSRGLLCRDLLQHVSVQSAANHAENELTSGDYAGCNFLLASRTEARAIEAADELKIIRLEPGMHLMANDALNDADDPRIERVRRLLEAVEGRDVGSWVDEACRICGITDDDPHLAICRRGADWGTVSSTILTLADPPLKSRFLYSPGPPSDTEYVSFDDLIEQLGP